MVSKWSNIQTSVKFGVFWKIPVCQLKGWLTNGIFWSKFVYANDSSFEIDCP